MLFHIMTENPEPRVGRVLRVRRPSGVMPSCARGVGFLRVGP